MHEQLPISGLGYVDPRARRVDVVRVELVFIIDHDTNLLEMKVAKMAGGRANVTLLGHTVGPLAQDPSVHIDVVRPLLVRLLEEYCEPF